MTKARGGSAVYGAPLGILMLDARFARIPGDMGNARTWPFPVLYRVVRGATPARVVLEGAEGLLPAFLDAAAELVASGAEALTTNCGFLAPFQAAIVAHCGVPVLASSLSQVPWIQASLPPGQRVGIVTICAASLSGPHLRAAGVPPDTPVAGTEQGQELFPVLIQGRSPDLDVERAREDVIAAGRNLVGRHPEVGAVVLECTNMPPYAAALRAAIARPVYDIYSMITWFQAGLRPRAWRSIEP